MSRTNVRIGSKVHYDGTSHRVTGFEGGSILLRSSDGAVLHIMASALFTAADFRCEDTAADGLKGEESSKATHWDNVAEPDRKAAILLASHLLEAMTGHRTGTALDSAPDEPKAAYDPERHNLKQRLAAKATELKISSSKLWKKKQRFERYGVFGLVDGRTLRVSESKVDARVRTTLLKVVDTLEDKSNSTKSRIARLTEHQLKKDYPDEKIKFPSAPTFNKLLDQVSKGKGLTGAAKTRRSIAGRPDTPYSQFRAHRPGEMVLIDSTPLDAFGMDPYTFEWVPIELTIAIDLYSRSLLAWRFTPVSTKGMDAALLLYDIVRPKRMLAHWPRSAAWCYVGVPETIVIELTGTEPGTQLAAIPFLHPDSVLVDRGRVFISEQFMHACGVLECNFMVARPYTPTDKAHVERFFKTIRENFVENLAGYKGPDLYSRGAAPEDESFWFLDEIEAAFAEWVATFWQPRHHEGLSLPQLPQLNISPNNMYEEGIARAGFVAVVPDPSLYFELLPTSWRTIQHYGVEIDSLLYDASILNDYRNQRSSHSGEHAGKWPFRRDDRDHSEIHFYEEATDTWHVIPWIGRAETARPFDRATLQYAKSLIIARGGNSNNHDELRAVLNALLNRMDDFETDNRKERRLAAVRAMNINTLHRDRPTPQPPSGAPPMPVGVIANHTSPPSHSPPDVPLGKEREVVPFRTTGEAEENDDDELDI